MALTNEDAERILREAPPDKCFVCGDGCLHKTLTDLHHCLSHMDEATYSHHVTYSNNDFSNWVRDVLGDAELAEELTKAKNRKESASLVKQRLTWLQKAKAKGASEPFGKQGFYADWRHGKKS
jgi:hypothetical protein